MVNVDFTYTDRVGLAPHAVDFTDITSGGPYTYRKWVFGDGESLDGNEATVSHTYKNPGVYSVSLILGDGSSQGYVRKEKVIYVNENIEDTKLVIAESKERTGAYWKFYIDADGKLVFETPGNKKITEEKILLTNKWMFIEYHVEEDRFYVGTHGSGRRHKKHITTSHIPILIDIPTGFFKIAPNSSYIIDDLKIWKEDTHLVDYFNSLRGRAAFLDSP